MYIKMLKSGHGESYIISGIPNGKYKTSILIDGGLKRTSGQIVHALKEILYNGETLNSIFITHVDEDHLKGMIDLFESHSDLLISLELENIYWCYFVPEQLKSRNDEISAINAIDFYKTLNAFITKLSVINRNIVKIVSCIAGETFIVGDAVIRIVSPERVELDAMIEYLKSNGFCGSRLDKTESYYEKTDEIAATCDYKTSFEKFSLKIPKPRMSLSNKSSIAFVLECGGKSILCMGDACPDIIADALDRIPYFKETYVDGFLFFDAIKLSHHGGCGSVSEKFLTKIKCKKFFILTNGNIYYHPKKKTMVDIIRKNPNATFYTNYKQEVFTEEEMIKYNFSMMCIGNNYFEL